MLTFRGEAQDPRMGARGPVFQGGLYLLSSRLNFPTAASLSSVLWPSHGGATLPPVLGDMGGNPKVENSPALVG